MLDGSSLALGGMGFVLATVALAHVERFYRRGFSRVPGLDSDPVPLRTAAERAYDYVREKRLPLAAIAESKGEPGDAVAWFENHMLKAVPVCATSVRTGAVRALGSLARAGKYAAPGGIAKSAGGEPAHGETMVSAKDFKAYLRWARTVW